LAPCLISLSNGVFSTLTARLTFQPRFKRETAMPLPSECQMPAGLGERLRNADAVTTEIMSDFIGQTCRRFPPQAHSEKSVRIERLLQSQAWTDVALALIDLELPQWQLRRIAYDEGEWNCALSRQRELPDWLDSAIEARHADLALALLGAFVEAMRVSTSASRTSVPAVRPGPGTLYEPVLCDNLG
jgi:hypothetical protein